MPHSIRDYFLNTNLTSGNYSSSSYSSTNASASGPSRGYTSSFNTTYSINPSTLPSYTYTNRFLQQQRAATAAAPASSGSARMTQYPPPQHQYYHSTPSGGPNNSAGPGYSSTYTGGGNSDRYNSSYSGGHQMSSTGPGSSGGTHSKTVCRMDCRYCSAVVCLRGMKAMLLADTSVELYSTDHPPGSVQLIDKDYTTSNCKCKIRDVACRVCGNVIGYHITQPCQQCLRAPNNGHFWMFHTEGVVGQERLSLDLAKLVQELVTFPHQAEQGGHREGATGSSTTNATGHRVESQTRSEAATSRQTSESTLERQQQQTLSRQRILTPSPSPATPTPSALQPANAATISNSISSTSASTPATDHVHREVAADTSSDPSAFMSSSPERPPTESPPTDMETEQPLYSAAAALSQLRIAMFLQPMKWEQLPHPDLDIDLDPGTMGGEPLFSTQWVDLVKQSAETAAANMTLALDQEEETERFVQRMQLEDHMLDQLEGSEASEEQVQEQGEDDEVVELETETEVEVEGEEEEESEELARGMEIEQLIDQIDSFGLAITSPTVTTSPTTERIAEESKDDETTDPDMDVDMDVDVDGGELARGRRRALEHRMQSAQPGEAPPPGQEGSITSHRPVSIGGASHPPTQSSPENRSGRSTSRASESTEQLSPETCPTMALASAMIAKAAASAAAADAASSANNLLFGRRSRRDYDMMCR
ncbi:Protein fam72a [Mortierella alpina]|nr:Protein fam72a [Mortierella alpina]